MQMRNETGNTAYEGAGRLNHTIWGNKRFNHLPVVQRLALVYLLAGPEFSPSGIFTIDPVSVGCAIVSSTDRSIMSQGREAMLQLSLAGLIDYSEPTCYIPGVREFYLESGIPGIKDQIDRDVGKVLPGPVLTAYRTEYGLYDDEGLGHSALSLAVALVTAKDPLQFSAHDWARVHLLEKKYTAKQVEENFGLIDGWWSVFWKGKNGQRPTIQDIEDYIGAAVIDGPRLRSKKKGMDEELAAKVAKLLRGSASNAKSVLGDETWAKLKAYKRWAHWKNVKQDNLKFEIFKAMNNE